MFLYLFMGEDSSEQRWGLQRKKREGGESNASSGCEGGRGGWSDAKSGTAECGKLLEAGKDMNTKSPVACPKRYVVLLTLFLSSNGRFAVSCQAGRTGRSL